MDLAKQVCQVHGGGAHRGLLAEFGIVIPQGIAHIGRRLPQLVEQPELPDGFRVLLQRLYARLKERDRRVDELEAAFESEGE